MKIREFFGIPSPTQEQRATSTFAHPSDDLGFALGVNPSAAGVSVTPHNALNTIAVYASVRVLAESVASLPFHVYERNGRGRVRVWEDERAVILDDAPNPEMSAFELWELAMGHLNLWGNAYFYKVINQGTGLVSALWPLLPQNTRPVRLENGAKAFITFLQDGSEHTLLEDEVIHIRAFGTGDVGISPIGIARQAIGLSVAAEEYAGRFFANDARPGGIIEYPNSIKEDAYNEAVRRWKAGHQGLKNSHLMAILDNGAVWKDVGMPNKDAQFLESRNFQVREVARLFRIPPHMIGDLEGAVTYASIEQQSLDFATYSLRPWLVRIEQQVKRSMFSSSLDKRRGLFPEFKQDGLLRSDTKTRYEAHAIAITNGWLSRNDVREMENLPLVDGLDEYLVPLNMGGSNDQPAADEPTQVEEAKPEEPRTISVHPVINIPPVDNRHLADAIQALGEREIPAPVVHVQPPDVNVEMPQINLEVKNGKLKKTLIRDKDGTLTGVEEETIEDVDN